MCNRPGYYTLLAWLPSYFELSLGLNVESSSLLTLIPYLAMTAMTPFVGPTADGLVAKGWTVTDVRKLSQARTAPTTLHLTTLQHAQKGACGVVYTATVWCVMPSQGRHWQAG